MALSLYIFVQNDETAPAWGDEGYVTTVPQEHINWEPAIVDSKNNKVRCTVHPMPAIRPELRPWHACSALKHRVATDSQFS